MRRVTFLRFLLASLASAMGLGLLSLFALRTLTENNAIEFRRSASLSLARLFEDGPVVGALERYGQTHPEHHPFRGRLWVTDEAGRVLTSNTSDPLPAGWESLPHPAAVHDIAMSYRFLAITPTITVLRLAREQPAFLVIVPHRESRAQRRDLLQIVLYGCALAFSALTSLLMTFVYLRKKSIEAREVLLRLERGDLKARFQIKQFDEMGSLMLDFNRMASEIERLVGRLEQTEQARKTLFQELSHDLRTPLTSLRGSIDTLASHWQEMPATHRQEVVEVCQTEIAYFTELLESLLFIAQMDEPRYKKSTEAVDLLELVDSEVRIRQAHERSDSPRLRWALEVSSREKNLTVPGDSQLIRRLIKNALENAGRFARSAIEVRLSVQSSTALLEVQDDGPGMTLEQIAQFGKARNTRFMDGQDLSRVSLGLGSVIMQKILDLHQGTLVVKSGRAGTLPGGTGTLLEIRLPHHS